LPWETIPSEADEVAADAIVLGTRGLTGLKSLMLGSVSHAILQHADRPVIVVPSPEVAARRAARLR
jgi:nucleotide-binding universal stress UspA family protein